MNSTNSIQNIARNTITSGQGMIESILVLSLVVAMTTVQGTIALEVFKYLSRGA